MKKNSIIVFIVAFIFAFIFSTFIDLGDSSPIQSETYYLQEEVDLIQKEFYRYYLLKNQYPESLNFVSNDAKQILEIYSDRFFWNEETKTLSFLYSHPVHKRSIIHILTFGVLGKSHKMLGININKQSVTSNAELFKSEGLLF